MADNGPDEKNDGATPPRPVDELPLHPTLHQSDPKAPATVQAVNVIPFTQTIPADLPVVAICPYCRTDLSTVTLGRYVATQQGQSIQALYPLRCPECAHPLLYSRVPGGVIEVHGSLG